MPSPHFTSVMPTLPVQELAAAATFYTETLGFEIDFENGSSFAIVSRGDVELGLATTALTKVPAGHGRCYVKLSTGIDEL
jgi:catechol 2,3-dioxygenase-like lactoylglutathione lyase family enzyme